MNSSIHDKITHIQEQYYKANNKHTFFKSSQKLDCATSIIDSFDPTQLFENAIYIIPGTNRIYFDYPFFKTFANPSIFESFVKYAYLLIHQCIQTYSHYEIHINWQTYSISAHERYKDLYNVFLSKYETSDFKFHDNLNGLYVYFTPTVIQLISKLMTPLIHPSILNKITLYNKIESDNLLSKVLHKTN